MTTHAHIYGDPRCGCPSCKGANPAYRLSARRPRMQPTPAASLIDISTREVSPHSWDMQGARIQAQAEANKAGIPIALGWQLDDDTGQKALGWCPACIAPHNCFVIEVLEVINPEAH
jgi:hypothetical protein